MALTEAEKYRRQAHDALARLSRAMDFFLNAAAQLVKLSSIHEPNEFSHCKCCQTPWPCETAEVIKAIATTWEKLKKEEDDNNK